MTNLLNVHGCLQELDDCANGLTWLEHEYAIALDDLREAEDTWATIEADASRAARDDAPKAATATEIRGRITEWVNDRPSARKARDAVRDVELKKARLEARIRMLEKRGGFAQSAQNGHEQIARHGGGA